MSTKRVRILTAIIATASVMCTGYQPPVGSSAQPWPGASTDITADPAYQPTPPIRAAFFYSWFPSAWTQKGVYPYTNYTPSLGFYDSRSGAVIDRQLSLAARAHLQAFIASWWGQGHHTDAALQYILNYGERADSPSPNFRWAIYYEPEGASD